ncbi:MAG: PDZ domain-containing protein [Acidobacteria bacterium]|nr:PDZ domain-containing protein [Acidobacteriota bacterium]
MKTLFSSMLLSAAAAFVLSPAVSVAQDIEAWSPDVSVFRIAAAGGSYLGVNLREVDSDRAKELKLGEEAGVEITRVEEDSPAARAGLKAGDVVLSYNGARVEGMEQFSRFVRETPAGRDVRLQISRNGGTQTITARIGARKAPLMAGMSGWQMPRVEVPAIAPMPDLPRGIMMWRTSALGIEAEPLRGQMADFFGVKEGVLVRSVMKDTAAAKAGLKAGDVIVKIGDAKIVSPGDVTSAIHTAKDRKSLAIVIMRDHHEMTVTASIDDDRSDWGAPAPRRVSGQAIKM